MPTNNQWVHADIEDDAPLWAILEGTNLQTGQQFFSSLVESVACSLQVHAAWVTELVENATVFRTLAVYMDGEFMENHEYRLEGTPCGEVVSTARLLHYPDNLTDVFPKDEDLKGFRSFMGTPILNLDGKVVGHLGVLDKKPMPKEPRNLALFQLFSARVAAEYQRLHAEEKVRSREEKLGRLIDSAFDVILELNENLEITLANAAMEKVFQFSAAKCIGRSFLEFLTPGSRRKLGQLIRELTEKNNSRRYLWIPGGLTAIGGNGKSFKAEASLSRSEVDERFFYSLILRNVEERRAAERKIRYLQKESEYLRQEIKDLLHVNEFIGESRAVREVLRDVAQVASGDTTVLVTGETGTGKELVARLVHAAGPRRDKPLIKVNCAAIPDSLMESEFFGHEKGSFTGAHAKRAGRFTLADGGTLFLDEIGELPIGLQAKLLRVVQEGEFEAVGSSETQKIDVRVIAATNRDLQQAVEDGLFRKDLFYRLNVFPIHLPPLKERGNDVVLLAESFTKKFAQNLGQRYTPLGEEEVERLKAYDWPGNVRELENVVERALITSRNGRLNLDRALPETRDRLLENGSAAKVETPSAALTADQLRDLERKNILVALDSCNWRVAGQMGASSLLGLHESTLRSRMKALNIERPH